MEAGERLVLVWTRSQAASQNSEITDSHGHIEDAVSTTSSAEQQAPAAPLSHAPGALASREPPSLRLPDDFDGWMGASLRVPACRPWACLSGRARAVPPGSLAASTNLKGAALGQTGAEPAASQSASELESSGGTPSAACGQDEAAAEGSGAMEEDIEAGAQKLVGPGGGGAEVVDQERSSACDRGEEKEGHVGRGVGVEQSAPMPAVRIEASGEGTRAQEEGERELRALAAGVMHVGISAAKREESAEMDETEMMTVEGNEKEVVAETETAESLEGEKSGEVGKEAVRGEGEGGEGRALEVEGKLAACEHAFLCLADNAGWGEPGRGIHPTSSQHTAVCVKSLALMQHLALRLMQPYPTWSGADACCVLKPGEEELMDVGERLHEAVPLSLVLKMQDPDQADGDGRRLLTVESARLTLPLHVINSWLRSAGRLEDSGQPPLTLDAIAAEAGFPAAPAAPPPAPPPDRGGAGGGEGGGGARGRGGVVGVRERRDGVTCPYRRLRWTCALNHGVDG